MEVQVHSILSKSGDVFILNLTSEEQFTNLVLSDILKEIADNLRSQDVSQDIDRSDSGLSNGNSAFTNTTSYAKPDNISQSFNYLLPDLIRDANETGD